MKKLYILFLLTALPFIGFGQTTIASYTFDTDKEAWLSAGAIPVYDAANYYTAEGSLIMEANNNALISSPKLDITAGAYTFTFRVKGTVGTIVRPQIKDLTNNVTTNGDSFTIPATGGDTGGDGGSWFELTQTIDVGTAAQYGFRIQNKSGSLATFYIDDVTIVSTAAVITTYSGFVKDPNFDDVNGVIPNWTPSSGDITASASSTSNSGAQAAKVDIVNTLSGNVILWNDYTLAFDSPTTTAASGDNVVITWDMRSSSTNLEVSPRFKMGKTAGGNDLYTMAKKIVTVVDTYQSFSITKALNASEEYNDIYTLGFTITTANAGDNVYIDNVTTTVTINGITLSVNNIDYKDDASISIYPNPVQNILNVNASKEVLKIEVFNILGQKMLSKENSSTVDISNLNKGVYITKIFQENDVISTKRFIKE